VSGHLAADARQRRKEDDDGEIPRDVVARGFGEQPATSRFRPDQRAEDEDDDDREEEREEHRRPAARESVPRRGRLGGDAAETAHG
jgi:hypothetical protein